MARVILVAALVTAIHPLWSMWDLAASTELAFAFFLGFFPELGLRVIQQGLVGVLRTARPAREERYPLRQLDGINVWTQARLLEEGIEDMQNLSTANLVDLMLHTRMPINRLLDWIDQAFLYVRVQNGRGSGDDAGDGGDRALLRRYSIRSATDLLDAFEARGRFDPAFRKGLLRLLNNRNGDDKRPSATEGLRRTLEGEVNLWHIRQWKKHTWLTTQHGNLDDGPADPRPQPATARGASSSRACRMTATHTEDQPVHDQRPDPPQPLWLCAARCPDRGYVVIAPQLCVRQCRADTCLPRHFLHLSPTHTAFHLHVCTPPRCLILPLALPHQPGPAHPYLSVVPLPSPRTLQLQHMTAVHQGCVC
jgi:hypothetical protein